MIHSNSRDLARFHLRALAPGWVQPASETSLTAPGTKERAVRTGCVFLRT
jgi:hypothetical protein